MKHLGMISGFLIMAVSCSVVNVAAPPTRSLGVWQNPQNSVHIRAEPCGEYICGIVVWANDKAKADARKGGTQNLVGVQLFRKFRRNTKGGWIGSVFIPDIGKKLSGTVTRVDADTLVAKGCLLGKIGCKSQRWTRVGR